MGVETLIAKEAIGLLRRRPSKLHHVLGTYLVSLADCEAGRAGRAAYFFVRYMDDMLDRDRPLPDDVDALTHVASMRSQLETGTYTGQPEIMRLAEYSLNVLGRKARPDDNPRQDFLEVIDAMSFDYQRSKERRTLTTKELRDYYWHTFSPIVNLMLIGLESQFRAGDVPALSFSQGRVLAIRDLKRDWDTGLIDIPEEILHGAGLTPRSTYTEVVNSAVFRAWARIELQKNRLELLSLQAKLRASPEKLTFLVCNGIIDPLLGFIKDYSSSN